MIRYEVTVAVREDLRERFERYFLETHIPEILATGCFVDIRFDRADSGSYRTVYHAATRADLDRYLSAHTARFRADFLAHFPAGVVASRENWTEVREWKLVRSSAGVPMFKGAYTVKYAVPDLAAAKAWYQQVSGVAPYFDEPFYVGFNIAGDELGLDPDLSTVKNGPGGTIAYWGVSDLSAAHAHLLSCGATSVEPVAEVGGGIKVATVADPWGNLVGIIENPHHS